MRLQKTGPSYTPSFNSARALAGLNGKVSDLHGSIHSALDVIFTRRLDTRHIKALVEWIIPGNSTETFNENGKSRKGKTRLGNGKEKGLKEGIKADTASLDLDKLKGLLNRL